MIHKSEEEDKPEEDNMVTVETVNNEQEKETGVNKEQQPEELVPPAPLPQPRAVQ